MPGMEWFIEGDDAERLTVELDPTDRNYVLVSINCAIPIRVRAGDLEQVAKLPWLYHEWQTSARAMRKIHGMKDYNPAFKYPPGIVKRDW